MAGIYIHIPFCKQACTYCDFYFSISLSQIEKYIVALKNEIELRKLFFERGEEINTIYFGGGTPSILNQSEINKIFISLEENFELRNVEEITFECNPDDLTEEYIRELEETKINRLSLGVQSFSDSHLKFMNRRHNSKKSLEVINRITNSKFNNYSIDIIFGIPSQTKKELLNDLKMATNYGISHISIYQLTFEPGTQLYYKLKKGRVEAQSQNESEEQYNLIIDFLENCGYEHYEVSNFAKPGMYSKHNTLYWRGKKYLGLGAGAHSYDGIEKRRWNFSSIKKYLKAENFYEEEQLDETKKYNEIVLTRLRTKWGVNQNELKDEYLKYFIEKSRLLIDQDLMIYDNDIYKLSNKGMLLADKIMEGLFYE